MIGKVYLSAQDLVKLYWSHVFDDFKFRDELKEMARHSIENLLPDFREVFEKLIQEVINEQFNEFIGAQRYKRSKTRVNYRNGSRPRTLLTSLGKLELKIPKSRYGSFFPSVLKQYQRITDAMICTIQEAYIHGVSTRSMNHIYKELQTEGFSKSTISRLCQKLLLDTRKWNQTPLKKKYLYIWLDGKYVKTKVTLNNKVCILHGLGVTADGKIESLGYHMAPSESESCWTYYLNQLKSRGLESASLWIRDNGKGLIAALDKEFPDAHQQRCLVHWMRNVLSKVSASNKPVTKLALQLVSLSTNKKQFNVAYRLLCKQLEDHNYFNLKDDVISAKEDINNHFEFPKQHQSKIKSNNVIERLNGELNRRFKKIPIFPTVRSIEVLAGAILREITESWDKRGNYLTRAVRNKKEPSPEYEDVLEILESILDSSGEN